MTTAAALPASSSAAEAGVLGDRATDAGDSAIELAGCGTGELEERATMALSVMSGSWNGEVVVCAPIGLSSSAGNGLAVVAIGVSSSTGDGL